MFWEPLALLGILVLWGFFGLLPWAVALFAGRGRGALVALPLACLAGIGAGVLVPAFGAKGGLGFGISLLTATLGGAIASAVVVRRAIRAEPRRASGKET